MMKRLIRYKAVTYVTLYVVDGLSVQVKDMVDLTLILYTLAPAATPMYRTRCTFSLHCIHVKQYYIPVTNARQVIFNLLF